LIYFPWFFKSAPLPLEDPLLDPEELTLLDPDPEEDPLSELDPEEETEDSDPVEEESAKIGREIERTRNTVTKG
jgi:hypothetical protein